jgi:hypothetical protein
MQVRASVIVQNHGRARPDHEVDTAELHLAQPAEPLGFESIRSLEHRFTRAPFQPGTVSPGHRFTRAPFHRRHDVS